MELSKPAVVNLYKNRPPITI